MESPTRRRGFLGMSGGGLFLALLLGAFLGVGFYTFYYAEGASYFSSDPRSCANCHVMREHLDSWQRASHHATARCVDCHLPADLIPGLIAKAENGFWHSAHFTLETYPDPIRIKPKNARILNANCIRCHQNVVGDLLHHGAFKDENDSCVRCHPSVGHGPRR
jgi:cytochrome c nitrite reductase small subunit